MRRKGEDSAQKWRTLCTESVMIHSPMRGPTPPWPSRGNGLVAIRDVRHTEDGDATEKPSISSTNDLDEHRAHEEQDAHPERWGLGMVIMTPVRTEHKQSRKRCFSLSRPPDPSDDAALDRVESSTTAAEVASLGGMSSNHPSLDHPIPSQRHQCHPCHSTAKPMRVG